MKEKTMTEVLIEMMNDERRPIPIKEFLDGLRRGGFITKWERLDDAGFEYKITFNPAQNITIKE